MDRRPPLDILRKLGAVLLVLASVATGILGLGFLVEEGRVWGLAFVALVPLGIWAALLLTPEGGTSGYCDQNL